MKIAVTDYDVSGDIVSTFILKLRSRGFEVDTYRDVKDLRTIISEHDGVVDHGSILFNLIMQELVLKKNFKIAIGIKNPKISVKLAGEQIYVDEGETLELTGGLAIKVPVFNYEQDFEEIVKYFSNNQSS